MSEYSKHENMVREEAIGGLVATGLLIIFAVIGVIVVIADKLP